MTCGPPRRSSGTLAPKPMLVKKAIISGACSVVSNFTPATPALNLVISGDIGAPDVDADLGLAATGSMVTATLGDATNASDGSAQISSGDATATAARTVTATSAAMRKRPMP